METTSPPAPAPDFETSLDELETLVTRLERGDLSIEDALASFERGIALTRQCQGVLATAQQKVEILLAQGAARDGARQTREFHGDADDDDAGK